jgi:hypothetical protein
MNRIVREGTRRRYENGQLGSEQRTAAKLRLSALVGPSIRVLARALNGNRKLDRLAIMAARDVLDRNGFRAADMSRGQADPSVHHVVSFVSPTARAE